MTHDQLLESHFWHAYNNIDIWKTTDTAAGKDIYFFWYDGKIYEQDTEAGIFTLAKVFTEDKMKANNPNTRRSR